MYRIEGATHQGLVRLHNEDRYAGTMLTDDYGYALVCDGMGGEKGGSIASTLACEEIRQVLDGSFQEKLDEKTIYLTLEAAIESANRAVLACARESGGELSGMGTTASLAVVLGDTCYLANVGDSRVYLLHQSRLTQLTVDHTRVQNLIDLGEITEQEAQHHPQRHYLTKAVGVDPQLTPFFRQQLLSEGDLLLLCSDGLYGMMDRDRLEALLCQVAAGGDCQLLINEANRLGGQDNITAVAVVSLGGTAHG